MKTFLIAIFLFFSALIQISFLPYFSILNRTPNLILVIVLVWNLYEDRNKSFGFIVAILGGFFLDIFSEGIIGYQISILLVMSILIKVILKKHVRIPFAPEI